MVFVQDGDITVSETFYCQKRKNGPMHAKMRLRDMATDSSRTRDHQTRGARVFDLPFAPPLHRRKNGRWKHARGKTRQRVRLVHDILEVSRRIPCFAVFLLLWRRLCICPRILCLIYFHGSVRRFSDYCIAVLGVRIVSFCPALYAVLMCKWPEWISMDSWTH